ncbi:MAG TPA: alpha/beta fold hydrolase [Gammaproteobacteria bacterium]|nr:alpha/beta fold hydrolase [Gammaproteobacteria bacterium]
MSEPVELAYDALGAGPPLLILHGLFGSARNWQSVARALSDRYRVLAVDARNHGRSPHTTAMDYRLMAADVAALIERLRLGPVTLLGHSMGGKTAMTLALLEPARVARLIVVDIAPLATPDQHTAIIDAMRALPLADIRRRQQAEEALAAAVPDREVRLFLLQNFLPGAEGGAWRFNLDGLRAAMPALIDALPVPADARYAGPVHVIRGARSERVTSATLAAMQPAFLHVCLHTVAHGGHWPHAEAPAEFMLALEDALAI